MAKGRMRQRQINKAVNPNFTTLAARAGELGTDVTVRPFALMEAIQTATGNMGGGQFDPLPRDLADDSAFGPMSPLVPEAIDALNGVSRTDPRTFQYQVGWNLPGNGNREVPWQVLRAAAQGIGIIRRCIEVRKKHVRTLRWVFGVSEDAINDAYQADPGKGKLEAERTLRERLMPEINRQREFWRKPWKSNDADFGQWVNAVMEDYQVCDGVAIFPRKTYGGDVYDLELLDVTTIKPLLDARGARPLPPHPAFQQVLYGFPRGEWVASAEYDEAGNALVSDAYASSELFYRRENFRSFSPYGFSPVEMALFDARLYLQRQKWMLAEYDDGSTPLTWIETAPQVDGKPMTLTQQRLWEKAFNAKVGGQTKERMRAKVLPNGWKANQMAMMDERYKPEYDLHLIKLLASYFGVTIAELGFTEPTGLGNQSWHEGQAEVTGRLGLRPDTAVVGDIVNALSRQFLNMPPELEFRFVDPAAANTPERDTVLAGQRTRGTISMNEERLELGQSLLPFPEADMYFLTTPTGPIFLEGAHERVQQAAEQAQVKTEAHVMDTAGRLELEHKRLEDGKQARAEGRDFAREQFDQQRELGAGGGDTRKSAEQSAMQSAEIAAFRKWRSRHPGDEPSRPFMFKHVTPDDGWAELDGLTPAVVDFGPEWEWLIEDELTKSAMSWLEWNLKHPGHPRDAKGRWVKASSLVDAIKDQGKKDAEKASERAKGSAPVLNDPPRVPDLTPQERRALERMRPADIADEPDNPVFRAQVRQAKIDVARAHAGLLAEMEELHFINQASPDVLQHRFDAYLRRNKEHEGDLLESGHITRLQAAMRTGDSDKIDEALRRTERELGFERIGGDRWLAEDQMVPFDPHLHRATGARPIPGQYSFVLRPGYQGTFGGEQLVLRHAKVIAAEPEDVLRFKELSGGGVGPKVLARVPTWEELGQPSGPSDVGQKVGHQGGTYERLPGEPRRYRVLNAEGEDISDRLTTTSYSRERGWHESNQTAEDARTALNVDALNRERVAQAHASGSVKAHEAVPISWQYGTHQTQGLDDFPDHERLAIRDAMARWAGHKPAYEQDKERHGDPDNTRMAEPAVNAAIRGVYPRTEVIERDIQALDQALEMSRLKKGITTYRGFSNGEHILPDDWRERDLGGLRFKIDQYTPVSGDREAAAGYIGHTDNRGFGIRLRLPKGAPALAIRDEPGGMDDEGEIVLPRGLLFKVTKDLGADDEGLRWLEVAVSRPGRALTKAAEPDQPQTPQQPPAPPDTRWPGWLLDLLIAAGVTALLVEAMPKLNLGDLIARFLEWSKAYRLGDPMPDVRFWITQTQPELRARLVDIITPGVRQAHIEGALVGQRSAQAVVEAVLEGRDPRHVESYDIDWGDWEPGNISAAETLLEPGGLERLLYQSRVTINDIAGNRLDHIGRVLGRGLAAGDSPEKIARDLREQVMDNPRWARRIAVTETNRAMSYAAVMNYREQGIAFKGWMTAFDQRVCMICYENEFEAPGVPRAVPIDQLFPSGDPWPPAHPHCRCAPIPIIRFPRGETRAEIAKSAGHSAHSLMSWIEWNTRYPEHPRMHAGRFTVHPDTDPDATPPHGIQRPGAAKIGAAKLKARDYVPHLSQDEFDEQLGSLEVPDHIQDHLKKVFSGIYGDIHIDPSYLTIRYSDYDELSVKGVLTDEWGQGLGSFERLLKQHSDGSIWAHHEFLKLNDPDMRGQGFAQAFNARAEKFYREIGVRGIYLEANIDIGGYAWARAGYDWANVRDSRRIEGRLRDQLNIVKNSKIPPERRAEQVALAQEMIKRMNGTFGDDDFPTPFEVSQLGRWPGASKDDWWIGKAALIGSHWEGVKHLD